ncbi:heavy metal translocating P-type ATPase, partial [Nitrospinota bacterium]
TRFSRVYTPVVVGAAVLVALVPPVVVEGAAFSDWLYRALVVLVISCPCALVISIPLGYFGGVGGASRRGILVKGSNILDALASVNTVVFDKTGTLTRGVFKVMEVVPCNGFSREDLLRLAAEAESRSNHPIAQSIKEAWSGGMNSAAVENYEEIAGEGIRARVEGRNILAGSDHLMHDENIAHDVCRLDDAGTLVHLAADGEYAGYIVIADEVKKDAPSAALELKKLGVERLSMLTGDGESSAESVARKVGVDDYRAELLPGEKVEALERIMQETEGTVAFVGDGINDAPVIVRADVGIAMGELGSDAAIEMADVVLMTDAPSKVAEAIRVARKTRTIVWENILLALGVKSVFILAGIAGFASMWGAVFADVGVGLLAVFNAVRVLR